MSSSSSPSASPSPPPPPPPPPKRRSVYDKYTAGPHGIGDPDDLSLRKVEKDVLIAKKMRDIARNEKCAEVVAEFTECCKENGVLMVVRCRKENTALKECLTRWYMDENFREFCTKQYLEERSEYRRTGIPQRQRQKRVESSM